MADVTIDFDSIESVKLDDNTKSVVVTENGSVTRWQKSEDYVGIVSTGANAEITVNGFVVGSYSGTQFTIGAAVSSRGADAMILIGESGFLTGDIGLSSNGSNANLKNAGRIEAQAAYAVSISGADTTLHNSGVIFGPTGVNSTGANASIINEAGGQIISGFADDTGQRGWGVHLSLAQGFQDSLTNHGVIVGNVTCFAANDTIINDGVIRSGGVALSYGDDIVDTRGGTIAGTISGGQDNDTLVTDNSSYQIIELANEGFDTVKSTVSYTLNDNVEQLILLGKKNINATGNSSTDNYLYGNRGNNILNGLDGHNEIYGFGGRDTLIGGTGNDVFGFGKGYGRDTINNYVDEQDTIAIRAAPGLASFDQVKSHIDQHGNDVWLDLGHSDLLIIKGGDASLLEETDFSFVF